MNRLIFFSILGTERKLYEGDREGNGPSRKFFLHPHGQAADSYKAAGRVFRTILLL